MKKFALTLLAVAFGTCAGFAQTTPSNDVAAKENTVQALTIDKMSNRLDAEDELEDDRRTISIYALPETVVEQIKYSALAGHTILSVTEVQPQLDDEDSSLQYELILQDGYSQGNDSDPVLIVRFDEFGELLSKKETTLLAQEDK